MQPQEIDYGTALIRMLISLTICVGLLVLTVWFLRRVMQARYQKPNKGQSVHVVEKRMISPKSALYLVTVEGRRLLIAESQNEIKMKFLDLDHELPSEHSIPNQPEESGS